MKHVLITKTKIEILDNSKDWDLKELYRLLNCDCIDITSRYIGKDRYQFIVDDMGLLKNDNFISAHCLDYREVLVGNIIITKYDEDGELEGLNDDEVKEITSWIASSGGISPKYGDHILEYSVYGMTQI